MEFHVGLLGFTAHRVNLLRVVLGSASRTPNRFIVELAEAMARPDIIIVETDPPLPEPLLRRARESAPAAVWVYVSEHGLSGDSRFRLDRRSLLTQIGRTLDQVVREEILTAKVRTLGRRPAEPLARMVVPPPAVAAPAPVHAGLMALVVDDSASLRTQVREYLQGAGLACHEAESAEQAMSRMERHWYDVALFDVVMPGVDGYELCRRVKHDARTRRLPVLMLTSRSSPFDRARGALVGCDSYLTKPLAADAFHRALDAVLAKAFKNDRAALAARGYSSRAAGH